MANANFRYIFIKKRAKFGPVSELAKTYIYE
jgi:hypothetical protein